MANPEPKLNPNLFTENVEMKSMRAGFGEGLVLAGAADKKVVALCGDLTESTGMLPFKNKYPERFIQVGVAEQNLVTVAAGLAAMGKIPFAASYAVFSPGRNWEQIRTTICYNNLPVKIVGTHAGLNVGPDGGSHQALEDIALMRSLPRMVVLSPCDAIEARKAIVAAAKSKDPTYIRLPREKSPIITTEEMAFEIGRGRIVFESEGPKISQSTKNSKNDKRDSTRRVGIIATGPLLYQALLAAKKLATEGCSVKVLNISTIKPLDEAAVVKLAHECRALVTVEEHQLYGGLGSAVAECLAAQFPTPIEFVAVKDKFGQSGKSEELIKLYELDEAHILKAAKRVMLRCG